MLSKGSEDDVGNELIFAGIEPLFGATLRDAHRGHRKDLSSRGLASIFDPVLRMLFNCSLSTDLLSLQPQFPVRSTRFFPREQHEGLGCRASPPAKNRQYSES